MTAWGTGPFENDDAQAWAELLPDVGPELIEQTLDQALTTAGMCERIVAAAEAVAALSGSPHMDWPPTLRPWLKHEHGLDMPRLRIKAVASTRDVMSGVSPLRQQWSRFGEDSVWLLSMEDLLARLGAA